MEKIQFYTYEQVQEYLGLKYLPCDEFNSSYKDGIESIKLITHDRSYNYTKCNNKLIYMVGIGPKISPGHPSGHQTWNTQDIILTSYANLNKIHIIHENEYGIMKYFGVYRINEISRQISDEGFVYCQIKLQKEPGQDLRF